jgi:hypothetical protein
VNPRCARKARPTLRLRSGHGWLRHEGCFWPPPLKPKAASMGHTNLFGCKCFGISRAPNGVPAKLLMTKGLGSKVLQGKELSSHPRQKRRVKGGTPANLSLRLPSISRVAILGVATRHIGGIYIYFGMRELRGIWRFWGLDKKIVSRFGFHVSRTGRLIASRGRGRPRHSVHVMVFAMQDAACKIECLALGTGAPEARGPINGNCRSPSPSQRAANCTLPK